MATMHVYWGTIQNNITLAYPQVWGQAAQNQAGNRGLIEAVQNTTSTTETHVINPHLSILSDVTVTSSIG